MPKCTEYAWRPGGAHAELLRSARPVAAVRDLVLTRGREEEGVRRACLHGDGGKGLLSTGGGRGRREERRDG